MATKKINKQAPKIICAKCQKEKSETNYYSNNNPLFASEKSLVCKPCLNDYIGEKDSIGYLDRVVMVLGILNKPFLPDLWESRDKDWARYIPQLSSFPQYKDLTYRDSDFLKNKTFKNEPSQNKSDDIELNNKQNLIVKWGNGYLDIDLLQLENFYNDMLRANDITMPQHKAQLELLCKLHVAQNKALVEERYSDFQKINTQYNKTLENSGFRPIDRQGGGESSGIRTFSQIWEEIERDGFIQPVPIEENQDIIDKTIMYMSNYTRKLLNMQSLSEPQDDTPKVDDNG